MKFVIVAVHKSVHRATFCLDAETEADAVSLAGKAEFFIISVTPLWQLKSVGCGVDWDDAVRQAYHNETKSLELDVVIQECDCDDLSLAFKQRQAITDTIARHHFLERLIEAAYSLRNRDPKYRVLCREIATEYVNSFDEFRESLESYRQSKKHCGFYKARPLLVVKNLYYYP